MLPASPSIYMFFTFTMKSLYLYSYLFLYIYIYKVILMSRRNLLKYIVISTFISKFSLKSNKKLRTIFDYYHFFSLEDIGLLKFIVLG